MLKYRIIRKEVVCDGLDKNDADYALSQMHSEKNEVIEIEENKVTKDDMYTKVRVTEADVRWEYVKLLCWLGLGYGYYHFVIAGWMW